jgi:ABC-type transport system involved in multi-copper enzyme maturation permease subunit
LLYKEEKDKTIEFLYSLEVSRIEIYMAKALTSILGTLVISFAAVSSTILCGMINGGETFDVGAIVRIAKFSGFIPFLFTAFALFLAGITAKFKVSMASSMLVFFTYLLGYLSTLLGDKATWLAYISPFEVLNANLVSDAGEKELISILICIVIFLIFVIAGGFAYNKRDFHV